VNNRWVTIDEVANHLHVSRGFTREIIRSGQGFIKFVQRGFPSNSQKSTSTNMAASTC
jgi:hypothetical protein